MTCLRKNAKKNKKSAPRAASQCLSVWFESLREQGLNCWASRWSIVGRIRIEDVRGTVHLEVK